MIDEKSSYKTRFEHLLQVISSDRFRKKQGLGNEIPFFICPYLPECENDMKKMEKQLINQLADKGITALQVNLYDLAIELIQGRGLWDRILKDEQKITKEKLKELLQGVLDLEQYIVPAIAQKIDQKPFEVMFITGVGEVFPYIRTHNLLNNLQSTAKEKPTILFFPGQYTHSSEGGSSLDLFGRLHDDKYYRAFNIYQYKV